MIEVNQKILKQVQNNPAVIEIFTQHVTTILLYKVVSRRIVPDLSLVNRCI